MNCIRPLTRCLAIAALILPGLAPAEALTYGPYAGISATLGYVNYKQEDRPKGYQAFAGYQFNNPLFVEASYLDPGKAELRPFEGASEGVEMEYDGYTVGVGLAHVFRNENVRLWVLGSYYDLDTTLHYPAGSVPGEPARTAQIDTSSNGGSVAVGGDFNFSPYVGLRARVERLFSIKDGGDDEDLTLVSVGVFFSFPVHSDPDYKPSRIRLVPLTEAPAPYATPVESCQRGASRLETSQPLRNQPKADAPFDQTVPSGTPVMIEDVLGPWCLANAAGVKGWIPAAHLE